MIVDALRQVRGACSLLLMTKDKLIGARDARGSRPLCIGRLDKRLTLASESCALNINGAGYIRDVQPGELVVVDKRGLTSTAVTESTEQAKCIFEFSCFSRPDSRVFEENVDKIRRKLGVVLAKITPSKQTW